MAINFPDSPSLNDYHVASGRTWKWNGTVWERIPAAGAQGVQGAQGAQGAAGAQGSQGLPAGGYSNKNLVVPDAYAVVGTASSGTGLGINWGAYNSSNGRIEFAFHYAQPNTSYYVHTNREAYATHNVEVSNKTTTGFRTKWSNSDGSNLSPATFPGVIIVYASDPIEMVGIGSTGNTGAQGHQGVQGATGAQGHQGVQGAQGHQGVQGAQGHQGRQGAQGVQGAVGAQGAQGHQGHQGVQGATGSTGAAGAQGAQGHQGVQGAVGAQGNQGVQGAQGRQGADGNFGGATFDYTFNTSTSDADPGAGKLGFNNGTLSSATVLYIDDEDGGGTDVQAFLRTIDDSTSTIKGHVRISNRLNADDFAIFTISGTNTEATGYHKVTVAYVSGATSFTNNEDIIATFARTGTKGDTGNTGAQGVQGAQGHQGVQGAQGHQGVQGATGAQGHQGVQGAQGHQGHQGVQGAQGRQGATGNTGAQGHQGVQGATGPGVTLSGSTNNQVVTVTGSNAIQGESTLTYDGTNLDLGDSKKIRLGNSQDLEIYHDGESRIKDAGTGGLYLQCSRGGLINAAASKWGVLFEENSLVKLFHDGSAKLETTSTGATVTGKLVATGDIDSGTGYYQINSGTTRFSLTHDGANCYLENQIGSFYVKTVDNVNTLEIANDTVRLPQDNDSLYFGAGNDLRLYSDGTNGIIRGMNGDLYLQSDSNVFITDIGGNETFIKCIDDGAVELYHNNSRKIETKSYGMEMHGHILTGDNNEIRIGNGPDFVLSHDGTSNIIDCRNDKNLRIVNDVGGGNETMIECDPNGSVDLYYNSTKVLYTEAAGVDMRHTVNIWGSASGSNATLALRCTGGAVYNSIKMYNAAGSANVQLLSHAGSTLFMYANHYNFCVGGTELIELTSTGWHPRTSSTAIDLGTSSKPWRNVYTNDLNLSNERIGSNDVDGTWGSYTIQEGENDLFLINRRSGKKYKFNLTEVS